MLLLSIVLDLCSTIALPIIKAGPQKQRIYVDPKDNEFSTGATSIGSNFTVSIKSAGWTPPGVFGYELKLYYNNTLLEAVVAKIPNDAWINLSDTIDFGPKPPFINHQKGFILSAATLLGEQPGRSGGGILFTVTFKIIKTPPKGGNLSGTLELTDIIMLNPNGEVIPPDQYDIVNGNYLFSDMDGCIYIRPDGSIDPSTAPILRAGDVYTFTGNIYDSIVIERDSFVLDGAGYAVEGLGNGTGISL